VEEAVRARAAGEAASDGEDASDASASPAGEQGLRPGLTPPKLRPPGMLELEELLAERLSTRVSVTMSGARGKVVIDFADLEDLERLYHLMSGHADDQ
jgi:ParB family chromosome partitioning protein